MEPSDSGGVGAVEVAVEQPMPTFAHGACTGVALAAIAAHCWLAVMLSPLRGAYRELGSESVPLVVRSWWLWGVPAAGLVAFAVLVIRRPRGLVPYACVAVLLVATAIATWHFAYAPLTELSSDISG